MTILTAVPINLAGGTYRHKSLPLSAQVTQNFWPQVQQVNNAKSNYILESFPGKVSFGEETHSADRGMLEHQDILYKVSDTTLYSVDSNGAHTSLGSIPGVGRCIMDGIGSSIVIVTGGVPYVWNGSTLTTVTDPDLETPNSCAHLNNRVLFDGDDGRFWVSDTGDATSIDSLNYASAESNADDLLRVYVHNQIAYMMGTKTIEPWWNSGVGTLGFDRVEGAIMQIGLGALHSAAHTDDYVYILGNNNQVYAIQGQNAQAVSTQAIARQISGFSLVSDAIGFCYNLDGQWLYELTFPTADMTFVYPEGGEWFQLSSGALGGRNRANSYAFAYRKHLVGDVSSGKILELDPDVYDDDGDAIIRKRDSAPLHGGLFGTPGKTLTMNRFELIMETGVGLLTGQGSDPAIMLSFSDDGGKTFTAESWGDIDVGTLGQFIFKVQWHCLGSFESRIIRIQTSDPVYYSIHAATADIEIGI